MRPRLLVGLACIGLAAAGLGFWQFRQTAETSQSDASERAAPVSSESVAALGTLEPQGDVLRLAAPTVGVLGAPRISKLFVIEGDPITKDQVLAEFDNRQGVLADIEEIDARLVSLDAQITLQEQELARYANPSSAGALSLEKVEDERIILIRLKSDRLETLAQRQGLKVELAKTILRSPIDGLVLSIHARVGERPTNDGVMEVGDSNNMQARIEVYESDISKLKEGQIVTMVSENGGFDGDLQGKVILISPLVQQREVLSTDPTADADARIVEVLVSLDSADASRVSQLSGLKVVARFTP
jgi:HlyD family secretion protein